MRREPPSRHLLARAERPALAEEVRWRAATPRRMPALLPAARWASVLPQQSARAVRPGNQGGRQEQTGHPPPAHGALVPPAAVAPWAPRAGWWEGTARARTWPPARRVPAATAGQPRERVPADSARAGGPQPPGRSARARLEGLVATVPAVAETDRLRDLPARVRVGEKPRLSPARELITVKEMASAPAPGAGKQVLLRPDARFRQDQERVLPARTAAGLPVAAHSAKGGAAPHREIRFPHSPRKEAEGRASS
jgi:hypothetical protein